MNVKETLKMCLRTYPSIFPNKWAVYHHIFLVNGCGYGWENGELVKSFVYDLPTLIPNDILKKRMLDFEMPEDEEIYPICEYSKICNIPDDIKPDWLEAAQEMYEWLIIHDELSDNNKKYIDKLKL